MGDEQFVRSRHSSAVISKRGFSYFVMATTRENGKRQISMLGHGRMDESAAWADAAAKIRADEAPDA